MVLYNTVVIVALQYQGPQWKVKELSLDLYVDYIRWTGTAKRAKNIN